MWITKRFVFKVKILCSVWIIGVELANQRCGGNAASLCEKDYCHVEPLSLTGQSFTVRSLDLNQSAHNKNQFIPPSDLIKFNMLFHNFYDFPLVRLESVRNQNKSNHKLSENKNPKLECSPSLLISLWTETKAQSSKLSGEMPFNIYQIWIIHQHCWAKLST